MTIRLPMESMDRLDILAKVTERSKAYLAAKAIEQYLDTQEWQIQAIQEAVKEADSPDAKFLEHDEVVKRMKKIWPKRF
jgi:predicted transcriptional regulator